MNQGTMVTGPLVVVDPMTGARIFELGIRDDSERVPFLALYHPATGEKVLEAGPVEDRGGAFLNLASANGRMGLTLETSEHSARVVVLDPTADEESAERVSLEIDASGQGSVTVTPRGGSPARVDLEALRC